jgi:hypothetical protein
LVIVPSAFHLSKLPSHLHNATRVVMNGLVDASPAAAAASDPTQSSDPQPSDPPPPHPPCRAIDTFVYASAPNRGLEEVLRSWPAVRQGAPGARLKVFYGLHAKDAQLRQMMGMDEEGFAAWKGSMLLLLQQDGVQYIGEVCANINIISHYIVIELY